MDEIITTSKDDLRSAFPNFTGNFIVSGQPRESKTASGYVYSFSVYWQNWSQKEGYHGANYKRCFIYCNDDADLAEKRRLIHGKTETSSAARIHIKDGFPTQHKFVDKNGIERTEEEIKVRSFYPYHLSKDLKKMEPKAGGPGSAGDATSSGVQNYGAPSTPSTGEPLF